MNDTAGMAQYDGYHLNLRPEVARHVPDSATSLLDVGCGLGGFGQTMREQLGPAARIVGIDPVRSSVESAIELGVFDRVQHGYFPDDLPVDIVGAGFDVVTFNDVLEHVVDPWSLLRQVPPVLSGQGRVVAAIPNVQALPVVTDLVRGRWEYADHGILDRTHVRFFTRSAMVDLFESSGYVVESATGENSILQWKPYQRAHRFVQPLLKNTGWVHFVVVARPR